MGWVPLSEPPHHHKAVMGKAEGSDLCGRVRKLLLGTVLHPAGMALMISKSPYRAESTSPAPKMFQFKGRGSHLGSAASVWEAPDLGCSYTAQAT